MLKFGWFSIYIRFSGFEMGRIVRSSFGIIRGYLGENEFNLERNVERVCRIDIVKRI